MTFEVNKQTNSLEYFIHVLDNSPTKSLLHYEDTFIKLYTFTVKDTDKDNIIGYRIDFLSKDCKISTVPNKMVSINFGKLLTKHAGDLSVIFNDTNFRIICYGNSGIYSFIIKKPAKKE